MDDPDVVVRTIHALKEEQTVAWRQLAASSLTTFERREVRNQLRQSHNELRQYLQLTSERVHVRAPPPEEVVVGFGKPNFRLLVDS
jgi:hypothetical protein